LSDIFFEILKRKNKLWNQWFERLWRPRRMVCRGTVSSLAPVVLLHMTMTPSATVPCICILPAADYLRRTPSRWRWGQA